MDFETMKKIVDGAPRSATTVRVSLCGKQFLYGRCENSIGGNVFNLEHLRTELAKREPMDLRAVDIPHGTIVLEK